MEVPVKPAMLQWARAFHALSPKIASAKLGISEEELRQMEKGHTKPTLSLLRTMASKYGLPLATLMRRTPPKTRSLPSDFRTIGNVAASLEGETVEVVRLAQDQQELASDLLEDLPTLWPNRPALRNVKSKQTADGLADRERGLLGISLEEQLRWTSNDQAFREWREHVHSAGVLVFVLDLPVATCRGFSLLDDHSSLLPVIVVNKEDTFTAKVFTLLHEYAHLLLRKTGVCDEFAPGAGADGIESYCNQFAGAVTIPTRAIAMLRPGYSAGTADWSLEDVSAVARHLRVSRQALALRLIQLGYAPAALYARVAAAVDAVITPASSESTRDGFPPFHIQRLHAVGRRYASLVVSAWQQALIDMAHANRMLGTQEKSLRKLAQHLEG